MAFCLWGVYGWLGVAACRESPEGGVLELVRVGRGAAPVVLAKERIRDVSLPSSSVLLDIRCLDMLSSAL